MNVLKRIFGSKQAAPIETVFTAPIAPDRTLCVIGDVHGAATALESLFNVIEGRVSELTEEPEVILVGDIVDRGEHSADVLTRVMDLEQAGIVQCLMGNHEAMMLAFLEDPTANQRWLRYGGLQTMASFGVTGLRETMNATEAVEARAAFRAALGTECEAWLKARPLRLQRGNVHVIHAGADPNAPLEDQDPKHLLWGHPDFRHRNRADGQWVVHGHVIVEEVSRKNGRINVDTGAYATGRLSAALIHTNGQIDVLSTQ